MNPEDENISPICVDDSNCKANCGALINSTSSLQIYPTKAKDSTNLPLPSKVTCFIVLLRHITVLDANDEEAIFDGTSKE